jgi:hypothetical protein
MSAAPSDRSPADAAAAAHRFAGTGRRRSRRTYGPVPARAAQSPPRAGYPLTRKITVRGARCAHVADAMALRAPPLSSDLPRQDPAPIRRRGEKQEPRWKRKRRGTSKPARQSARLAYAAHEGIYRHVHHLTDRIEPTIHLSALCVVVSVRGVKPRPISDNGIKMVSVSVLLDSGDCL